MCVIYKCYTHPSPCLPQDAGELYQACNQNEKAVQLYIQMKAFARAAPLMATIASPKLHAQFAKAKEQEGRYKEALESYQVAGDYDSMTRILLEKLH